MPLDLNSLKELCQPSEENKPYYRPFICNGDCKKAKIFLIGINPATPILPEEMSSDEYVEHITDYEKFIKYYKKIRIGRGKSEISRTRIGIDSFLNWLSDYTKSTVLQTDIITFPTENVKLLKREPKDVIHRAKQVFYEVLNELQPELLIVYGKEALEQLVNTLRINGVDLPKSFNLDCPIEDMEKAVPLVKFKYNNGNLCSIIACRHFMYYGSTGNSYSDFKEKLRKYLKDNQDNAQ